MEKTFQTMAKMTSSIITEFWKDKADGCRIYGLLSPCLAGDGRQDRNGDMEVCPLNYPLVPSWSIFDSVKVLSQETQPIPFCGLEIHSTQQLLWQSMLKTPIPKWFKCLLIDQCPYHGLPVLGICCPWTKLRRRKWMGFSKSAIPFVSHFY